MESVQTETRYVGFMSRAIADFFDSLLMDLGAIVIMLLLLGGVYWIRYLFSHGEVSAMPSLMDSLDSLPLQLGAVASRGALSIVYFTGCTYKYGTTLGKRILRIYVVTAVEKSPITYQQSILRCFAYAASYLPLGLGFLLPIFHPEKRALHDLIAGTVCVRRDAH